MNNNEKNNALRERSGNIKINSRLTSFLYTLMRDYVQPSDLERLVRDSEDEPNVTYSNGWLALYAQDLTNRLKDK